MKWRHVVQALRNLVPAFIVGAVILGAAFGLFVWAWGWQHFLNDFWPLDHSNVGPNLAASLFLVVLVVAHNEARTVQQAEEHHDTIKQAVHAALEEVVHPAETGEEHVAQDVVDQINSGV